MVEQKSYNIEFIKCISYLLVVVLHIIECSDDVLGESIYLLGSFAIPLFFLINGFLLSEKDFTFKYTGKKIYRLVKFVLLWGITVGIITGLAKRSFKQMIVTVIGAFIGKGLLYHLWFLTTLIIIYSICFLVQKISKKQVLYYVSIKGFYLLAIIFTVIFIIEISLNIEIRNLIPGCFRVLTYGGYFYCGMLLKKTDGVTLFKGQYSIITAALCWVALCFMANHTGIIWASSYYNSPMVFFGGIILLSFSLKLKLRNSSVKMISFFSQCTIAIWVFHPLVHTILVSVLEKNEISCSLFTRIIELPFIVCFCSILACLMSKNKYLIKYIKM